MYKQRLNYKQNIFDIILKDIEKSNCLYFIMLIGTAGSGKTTFAYELIKRNKRILRVCLDDIIYMSHFYNYDNNFKEVYYELEKNAISFLLGQGYHVLHDRTNLTKETRKKFINFVDEIEKNKLNRKINNINIIGVYFNVDKDICKERRIKDPLLSLREQYSITQDWGTIIEKQSAILEVPEIEEGFNKLYEMDENFNLLNVIS